MPSRSSELLDAICAEVKAGKYRLGPIPSEKGRRFHGNTTHTRRLVTINPSVEVVDTTIHEMLHRLRPQWSEQTVRSRTARLMQGLSDAEIWRLFRQIMRKGY